MSFKKLAVFLLVPVFSLGMIFNQSAHAESYFGGSIGIALPSDVDDIKLSSGAATGTITDLDADNSFTYGFKVGHYFKSIPWLGVEINFQQSDPDVDQQNATATGTLGTFTAAATGQGRIDVNHLTTIGFLAMLRPVENKIFNLEPYLGLGLGVNIVSLGEGTAYSAAGVKSGAENLGSDTDVGFLLSAGLNYEITDHIKAYGEYKYTQSNFESTTGGVKYEYDVDGSTLMLGAAYNF